MPEARSRGRCFPRVAPAPSSLWTLLRCRAVCALLPSGRASAEDVAPETGRAGLGCPRFRPSAGLESARPCVSAAWAAWVAWLGLGLRAAKPRPLSAVPCGPPSPGSGLLLPSPSAWAAQTCHHGWWLRAPVQLELARVSCGCNPSPRVGQGKGRPCICSAVSWSRTCPC